MQTCEMRFPPSEGRGLRSTTWDMTAESSYIVELSGCLLSSSGEDDKSITEKFCPWSLEGVIQIENGSQGETTFSEGDDATISS